VDAARAAGDRASDGKLDDTAIIVSLGSNIEPRRHLAAALRLLAERVEVMTVSSIYQTAPAVGASGPTFLNAAAKIRTELRPARLKFELLRPIEAQLGRVRGPDKNAPRTIDLDLAIYGELVLESTEFGLRIPDPDLLEWPHVTLPAAEILPNWIHPLDGRRLSAIAAAMATVEPEGKGTEPALRRLGSAERVLGSSFQA
jgi:2-amino-4-hydroxy-6-hydroxymethyldihydropteridine diphosphokinase